MRGEKMSKKDNIAADVILEAFNRNELVRTLAMFEEYSFQPRGHFLLIHAACLLAADSEKEAQLVLQQFIKNQYEHCDMDLYSVLTQLIQNGNAAIAKKIYAYENLAGICLYRKKIQDMLNS